MGLTEYTLHCAVLENKQTQQKLCCAAFVFVFAFACVFVSVILFVFVQFTCVQQTLHCAAVLNSESAGSRCRHHKLKILS